MNQTQTLNQAEAETPRRHRRLPIVLGSLAVVTAGCLTAAVLLQPQTSPASSGSGARQIHATAAVERKTLKEEITAQGTLTYASKRQLAAGVGGTITAMAPAGTSVAAGSALYAVDNQPVVLLRGGLPAWREFASGMSNGPDVHQLETALAALGHFTRTPDDRFDAATKLAIDHWQRASGLAVTGTIPLGRVAFSADDVRIAQDLVQVGDQIAPGTPVLAATSAQKVVTAQVKAASQAVAVIGNHVTVHLPANVDTEGTVQSVEAPTEIDNGGTKLVVVPVTITLTDPAATGTLQEVSISVDFPTASRPDVLTVPVGALIARPAGGFGVEVARGDRTTLISVKTGLFAGGFVEISGTGITAGQKVVVPKI